MAGVFYVYTLTMPAVDIIAGADESPLMTWGILEDTPIIVDHAPSSSIFRMPAVPKRDRIGLDLAEKVRSYKSHIFIEKQGLIA